MTSHHDIPCVDCVCVPVCRHKRYHALYWDCKLLSTWLEESLTDMPDDWDDDEITVFEQLKTILNPTEWGTTKSGNVDPRNRSRK